MARSVQLSQGQIAWVDEEDYDRVVRHDWYALRNRSGGFYACRNVVVDGKRTTEYMHRFILEASEGMLVDHKKHDTLNNTRENLRIATSKQNAQNRKLEVGRLKGVSWHKPRRAWRASIMVDDRAIHLGLYQDEEHAARVYDQNARKLYGEFASLNFPDDIYDVEESLRDRSSKFRGVSWYKNSSKWKASISDNGKMRHIGYFFNEEDAALAYDNVALDLHGDQAKLNFPKLLSVV